MNDTQQTLLALGFIERTMDRAYVKDIPIDGNFSIIVHFNIYEENSSVHVFFSSDLGMAELVSKTIEQDIDIVDALDDVHSKAMKILEKSIARLAELKMMKM